MKCDAFEAFKFSIKDMAYLSGEYARSGRPSFSIVCATMPIHHAEHMCSQFALLIDISTAPLARVFYTYFPTMTTARARVADDMLAIQYEHERCIAHMRNAVRAGWVQIMLINSAPFVRSQRFIMKRTLAQDRDDDDIIMC